MAKDKSRIVVNHQGAILVQDKKGKAKELVIDGKVYTRRK